MQTLHFGGSLGNQRGAQSTRCFLIVRLIMEKKQSLNSLNSKLLTAKTHFQRAEIVEFPLLCCELLSIVTCGVSDFLKRRVNTILEKKKLKYVVVLQNMLHC